MKGFIYLLVISLFYVLLQSSNLFVHCLDGSLISLDDINGRIRWSQTIDRVISSEYFNSPLIIINPIDGTFFEFATGSTSSHILHKHKLTISDYVKESPSFHGSFISIGSKSDVFSTFDVLNGSIISDSNHPSGYCKPSDRLDNTITLSYSSLSLSFFNVKSQGMVMNFTYKKFSSHTDEEDFPDDVRYMASSNPSLLKFSGKKLLWSVPLKSLVVGIYSYDTEPVKSVKKRTSNYLKKIHFPTFIPKKNEERFSNSNDYWKLKLNGQHKFTKSLYVSLENSQIYGIETIVENDMPLRPFLRAPLAQMIEGPDEYSNDDNLAGFIKNSDDPAIQSFLGAYEYPPELSIPQDENKRNSEQEKISYFFGLEYQMYPMLEGDVNTNKGKDSHQGSNFFRSVLLLSVIAIASIVLYQLFKPKENITDTAVEKSCYDFSSCLLSPSFDNPDENGLAGFPDTYEMIKSVGENKNETPEMIKINLNKKIGHGANGTIVFEGKYGDNDAAVKRIVRQSDHERHWIREHSILTKLNHKNLVKCYWTGSTINFHYLVMQCCDFSLGELLNLETGPKGKARTVLESFSYDFPKDGKGIWKCLFMDKFVVCHQLITAVAYLHHKKIVHRDLKPSNVLFVVNTSTSSNYHYEKKVNGRSLNNFNLLIGDFGLSRPLPNDRNDVTNSIVDSININFNLHQCNELNTDAGVAYGTLGWMAPELYADNYKLTNAIDIFSCGLIVFYIITEGHHPFDNVEEHVADSYKDISSNSDTHEITNSNSEKKKSSHLTKHHHRQSAIVASSLPNLNLIVTDSYEGELAHNIIEEMLRTNSTDRTPLRIIKNSPLFWEPNKIIRFICDTSDLVDLKTDLKDSKLTSLKKSFASSIEAQHLEMCSCFDWTSKLDPDSLNALQDRRTYDGKKVSHLLRAIRNKKNHFWELSERLKLNLGRSSSDMVAFWMNRYPKLLSRLYLLARIHLSNLDEFAEYLPHNDILPRDAHLFKRSQHFEEEDDEEGIIKDSNCKGIAQKRKRKPRKIISQR